MPKSFQAGHFDVYRPVGRNRFYKKQPDGTLRHETDLIVDHAIAFLGGKQPISPLPSICGSMPVAAEDGDRRPELGRFPWPQSAESL